MIDSLSATVRYSFTAQFVEAATIFARDAHEIEATYSGNISEEERTRHRGLVTAAILQCVAALETEAHEICAFGPGSHLGSNGVDVGALQVLEPLAEVIDTQDALTRYRVILHVLRRPELDRGKEPYQSTALLVRLRNEIVHYKSRWTEEMTGSRLFGGLEALRLTPPPFVAADQNFFPHRCLSAARAIWAVRSTIAFLDEVNSLLGVPSRFDAYRSRLQLPD